MVERGGHGEPAEAVALRVHLVARIAEDRDLHRRIIEAREFEFGIEGVPRRILQGEGFAVGGLEIGAHRLPPRRILDDHEAPGLAEADRRGKAGGGEKPIHRLGWQRVATKSPHVPPPGEEVGEGIAGGGGKARGVHAALVVGFWSGRKPP